MWLNLHLLSPQHPPPPEKKKKKITVFRPIYLALPFHMNRPEPPLNCVLIVPVLSDAPSCVRFMISRAADHCDTNFNHSFTLMFFAPTVFS